MPDVAWGDPVVVTAEGDGVRLRNGPELAAATLTELAAGARGTAAGRLDRGFAAVTFAGRAGWVFSTYLAMAHGDPVGTVARVTADGDELRLRAGPSLAAPILAELRAGALLAVIGETREGFVNVAHEGMAGWSAAEFLRRGTAANPWAREPGEARSGTGSETGPGSLPRPNWPSAEAIDRLIARAERINGRQSPLRGQGALFLRLGAKYGVNPGFVAAIVQRETGCGTTGDIPAVFNFGGIVGEGPCGKLWIDFSNPEWVDRHFKKFCSVEQGLEENFRLFDWAGYRDTAGTVEAILDVYSPDLPGEGNPREAVLRIFRDVAGLLGIALDRGTKVFAAPESTTGGSTTPPDGEPDGQTDTSTTPPPAPIVTAGAVRRTAFRAAPRDDAERIAWIRAEARVALTGQGEHGFLSAVRRGKPGWVAAVDLAAVVTVDDVNFRTAPDTATGGVIVTLPAGTVVTPTGAVENGFLAVAHDNRRGWLHAGYLGAGPVATVLEADVRLRSAPDAANDDTILIDGLPPRAPVALTGQAENGFLSIRYELTNGWVAARFLGCSCRADGVALRSQAGGRQGEVVARLAAADELTLDGKVEGGFVGIASGERRGWLRGADLGPRRWAASGFGAIWGGGPVPITFEYLSPGDLYSYGTWYGLDGVQHTGIDVGLDYGTTIFAPAAGVLTCAGTGDGPGADGWGCQAFNDTGDGAADGRPVGAGRVELLLDDGTVLILGHSRACFLRPGQRVVRGQPIGTSGGMRGAHIHVEARLRDPGTRSGWRIVDPRTRLGA